MKSPFPLAPYKGKKAIVHIIQNEEEREAWRGEMEGGCRNLTQSIVVFYVSPALLCMAAAPPVTSHLSIQEAVLLLFFSFFPCLAKRERREGREEKVTLALKPAIVLPPGQPANQAAQSERERETERERERDRERERESGGRDGCHGYFPGDASTLVYLLAEGACTAGPSR